MKTIMITAMIAMVMGSANAQNWNEWFRQKKTQKKYLMQQIAALQVYIGYAKQGYAIARDGLQKIGANTGDEKELHSEHFRSLSLVNPELRNDPQVNEILVMHRAIIYDYHNTYQQLLSSAVISTDELAYVKQIYNNVLADCQRDVEQLQKVGSDQVLIMTDQERMSRISGLHEDMSRKYSFSCAFSRDAKLLALSRLKEKKEIGNSRELNGNNTK